MDITFQTGIVTGAAAGIGHAVAKKLLEKGFNLALFDLKPISIDTFGTYSGRVKAFQLSITDEDSVKKSMEEAYSFLGRIDVLVNSAGITGQTGIKSHEVESEDLRAVFEVNFMGSYFTSKYALPYMLKHHYGRILHIASIAGKEGNAGMLAYSASKSAVIGMVKVQGKEYAGTGITVNGLAPAVIQTALVDSMPEQQVKYMTDKIPMNRCGTLEEASNLAAYIVSSENSFTTGFVFDLSGGRATY
jgi:3-oxoacyl-[acyl-carrier protein] reductase